MGALIEKYKISISIMTVVVVLLWVATTSRMVTAKEDQINHRLNNLEAASERTSKSLAKLCDRTTECEHKTSEVRSDIKVIKTDMKHILQGMERIERSIANNNGDR